MTLIKKPTSLSDVASLTQSVRHVNNEGAGIRIGEEFCH
jgi:hypothetical protein